MKNKIKDFKQKIKYKILLVYRRLFLGADDKGTIWFTDNKKCYREELVLSNFIEMNGVPVVGTYKCWINKEEVPFEGY